MDFYTLEIFKNKLGKLSFLEVQRLAFPLIDINWLSTLSSIVLDEYNTRLYDEEVKYSSIDNLISSAENNNGLDTFSYEDLKYLKTVIESVVYYGKVQKVPKSFFSDYLGTSLLCDYIKEDGSSYIHYEYDQKLMHLNSLIKKELNRRYCKKTLKKYGINNFDDMSYDDIEMLITSMAYIGNFKNYNLKFNAQEIKNTRFSKLFNGLYKILEDMDRYILPNDLNMVDYKKIKQDKLKRLQYILDLSLNLSNEDTLLYVKNLIDTSDVVINIEDLNEAFIVCESNNNEDIVNSIKNVQEELSSRKPRNYFEEVSRMHSDLVGQMKVKRF